MDDRTTRHEGYVLSIKQRNQIGQAFGWAKTIGSMAQMGRKSLHRAYAVLSGFPEGSASGSFEFVLWGAKCRKAPRQSVGHG